MWPRGVALAVAVRGWMPLLLSACAAPASSGAARTSSLSSAGAYSSDARGPAVHGEVGADALTALVHEAARTTARPLTGDSRLATLAERDTLDDWDTEQLGLPDVQPELHVLKAPSLEALSRSLSAQLPTLLAGAAFTHYGAALSFEREGPRLGLVLSRRVLRFDPVPRRARVGERLRLRGELGVYRDAEVVQLEPGGARQTHSAGAGHAFDVQVALNTEGVHVVEVTALGTDGRAVLARLRIHVGVEPAPEVGGVESLSAPEAAALRAELARFIRDARASSGLAALADDASLDGASVRFLTDWHGAQRAGRPSQQVLSAAERARRQGLAGGLAHEFLVHGDDVNAVSRALSSDAAARAAILEPTATHLGLGVARDPRSGQLSIAGLTVPLSDRVNAELAVQQLLARLNAARRARGAAALVTDSQLARVAAQHAGSFFGPSSPTQADVVRAVSADLERATLRYRRTQALITVGASTEAAATLEPALAADVEAIGIGVVQGDRPDTGARSLAVVLVLGYPRR